MFIDCDSILTLSSVRSDMFIEPGSINEPKLRRSGMFSFDEFEDEFVIERDVKFPK
jgi:hypothetical protein